MSEEIIENIIKALIFFIALALIVILIISNKNKGMQDHIQAEVKAQLECSGCACSFSEQEFEKVISNFPEPGDSTPF